MSVVALVIFGEKYLSGFISFKLLEVEIKPTLCPTKLTNLLANYVRGSRYFITGNKL